MLAVGLPNSFRDVLIADTNRWRSDHYVGLLAIECPSRSILESARSESRAGQPSCIRGCRGIIQQSWKHIAGHSYAALINIEARHIAEPHNESVVNKIAIK